jgi:transposase
MIECHDAPRSNESRRQEMLRPEEVEAMVGLYELGWGTKRIAEEFGCSRNTVKRYVATAGWAPYGSPRRATKLDGLEDWLKERFFQHRGNAEVVRQDLARELSIEVSPRTVERAVAGYRRLLTAEAKAKAKATLRDAARATTADRFRRDAGTDRRRADPCAPVRGDAGILSADLCAGVRAPAPGSVVRRS